MTLFTIGFGHHLIRGDRSVLVDLCINTFYGFILKSRRYCFPVGNKYKAASDLLLAFQCRLNGADYMSK